jgi:GTPase Era involved in 16S rRNA processing
MTTIVFHSSSLGVTEYEETFTGLAGDFVANAQGVHHVEGALDEAELIGASVTQGINTEHATLKRVPMSAYVQADSASVLNATVTTPAGSWTYPQTFQSQRTRRFIFGRGIRDSYIGFGLSNPDGAAFRIDRIEINTRDSAQRKVT